MRQSYSLLSLVFALLLCCGSTASADLVGWWTFDESTGTTAADVSLSTNQHDAALMGAATFAPGEGQFGGAMWLDGSTGTFAEVLDHADVEFLAGESFTISMWYKRNGVENDQGLITKGYQDNPRDPGPYYLLQTRTGGFTLDSREGPEGVPRSRIDDNSSVSHGDNQWHQFVVVRDSAAGEIRTYVDNQPDPMIHDMIGAGTGDWAMGVHDQTLVFGDHHDRFTRGHFDDIAIWKGDALTAAEIETIFNSGVGGLVNDSLVWDNAGPGEWADMSGGFSRWRDPDDFATQIPDVPDSLINVTLQAANAATVDVGSVATPAVRAAYSLTVNGGDVAIKNNSTLNVAAMVTFDSGTSLSLAPGAILATGYGGSTDIVHIAGTATIDTGGGLSVGSLRDDGTAATLVKTGAGTAQLAAVSAVAGSKLQVDAGTLVVTGNAAGVGSAALVLNGGVMQLDGIDILGAGPGGAVGNWKFDEAAGATASNSANAGVNEGTLVLMDDTAWVPGKIGNALAFDGVEQYVQITQNDRLPIYNNGIDNAYSVAMWVKGGPQSDRRVFAEASTASTTPLLNVGVNNSGESMKMYIRTDANVANPNKPSNGSAFDDTWHHIAWVDDDGTGKVYIDGVLDSQTFNYTRGTLSSLDTTTIGAILRGGTTLDTHHYKGLIDEVYVYNRALSDAEVFQMGASQAILPTTDVTVSDTSVLDVNASVAQLGTLRLNGGILTTSGGQTSFAATTINGGATRVGLALETVTDLGNALTGHANLTFAVGGTGTTQIVDAYAAGPSRQIAFAGTSMTGAKIETAGGTTEIVGTSPWAGATEALLTGGTLVMTADVTQVAPGDGPAGAVGNWKFDEASGTTAANSANGGLNAGTLVGMDDSAWVVGKIGNALQFDGLDDYVTIAHDDRLPIYNSPANTFSVAMWVKGGPQADKRVFSEGSSVNGTPLFNMGTDNTGATGSYNAFIRPGLGHTHSQATPFDDTWHHIAWVEKDGAATLYVDGLPDAQSFNYTRGTLTLDRTSIGGILRATSCCLFTGLIDEVYAYDMALSVQDVAAMAGVAVADMTSHNVTVAESSTLRAGSPWLNLGTLTLGNGTLTTAGRLINFTATTITGTAVGLNPTAALDLGPLDGSGLAATIAVQNSIVLDDPAVGMTGATFDVTGGTLGAALDGTNNPLGDAAVSLGGGSLMLSAKAGVAGASVDFDNAVVAVGGTISAGPGSGGHAGPMTVKLAATGGLNLTGNVELSSAASYELNVATKVTAPDSTTVNTGTVSLTAADSVLGTLTVNDGNVSVAGANTTVGTMNVAGGVVGTGGNEVDVTTRLALEDVGYEISGASMTAMGADLLSGAEVKVTGGTLTVNPPDPFPIGAPAGAVAHWAFDEAEGVVARDDSGLYHGDLGVPGVPDSNPTWQPTGGKIGGALEFDGGDLVVADIQGDKLPLYQNPPGNVISVAMWVKGPVQRDKRIFSEGSSTSNTPLYNLGTHNTGANGAFDLFVRSDSNTRANHIKSNNTTVFDDTWHHIAFVDNNGTATLYVDGVADTRNFNYTRAGTSKTDRVSIGGILRATECCQFTGMIDDVWIFDQPLTAADAQTLFEATAWTATTAISDDTTNLTIEGDATVTSAMQEVALGNLTVATGVGNLSFDNAVWTFQNATIADGVTISGEMALRGTLNVGNSVGTMTVDEGELVFDNTDSTAVYNAEVSLGDGVLAITADKIVLGSDEAAIHLDGALAPKGIGRTSSDFSSASTKLTVVDNSAGGVLTGVAGDTPFEFAAVDPALAGDGELAPHIGQGAFLTDVIYNRPNEFVTAAVELDVFIALGGDTDGDKKVWLSDWAALRANFGNTATDKTWTDGNFDPWEDGKVWLSDWAALRANFGNSDYTAAGAAAVPEPGTIVMLLSALAGLALAVRRRRYAA